jgi:hypothetical protein
MPGHSSSTIVGGTRHSASKMAPVPTVTVAPSAMLVTITSATAANQTRISLARVIFLNMILTLSSQTMNVLVTQGTSNRLIQLSPIAQGAAREVEAVLGYSF